MSTVTHAQRSMHRRRMRRAGVMPYVAIGAAVALLFALCLSSRANDDSRVYARVTIHSGDSVWSVARRTSGDGIAIARTVAAIERVNALKPGALTPGDCLLVPISEVDASRLALR